MKIMAISDVDANVHLICVAVLDRVVEKVHEYLAETIGVARCRGQLARYLDVERHRLKLRFHCFDRRLYDLADLDRLLVDPNLAVVDLTRQQHLVCYVSEAFCFRGEHLEKLVPLFAVKLVIAMQERCGGTIDSGHRRPKLVGDRRDEVALLLIQPHLFAQVPERVNHTGGALHRDE